MNTQNGVSDLALAPGVLSGMRIVMSGVGSGIGAATARRCIELDARVVGFEIAPAAPNDEKLTSLVYSNGLVHYQPRPPTGIEISGPG
jgi:hypothetical protein